MRKGETSVGRVQSGQDRWEAIGRKLQPALLEMAQLFKECIQALESLGPNASRELAASIEARLDERLEEIKTRYSGPVQLPKNSFPCEIVFPFESARDDGEIAVASALHWERHKVPLAQDIERMNMRDGEATRRILRTMADYEAIRCEQKKPKPFKGKIDHSNLFQIGLGPLGLQNLTAEELAIFFDRFCPSCREAHNANALRRQRAEFLRALEQESEPARADI
jgi:hypothetical protein